MDKALALSRVGGDMELLREIAGLFLAEYPRTLADLRSAAADGDAAEIERQAHTLKGSVSNFSDSEAVAAAVAIEKKGRSAVLTAIEEDIARLETALERLRPELESL